MTHGTDGPDERYRDDQPLDRTEVGTGSDAPEPTEERSSGAHAAPPDPAEVASQPPVDSYGAAPSGYPTQHNEPAYAPYDYASPGPYDGSGYEAGSYEAAGYEAGSYEAAGYEAAGYEASGYQSGEYDTSGYHQAYADPNYADPNYAAYTEPGYQQGYQQPEQSYPVPPAAQQQHDQPPQQAYAPQQQGHAAQPGYGQPPFAPQQSAPIPRPEDLLVPTRTPVDDQPASWGWRGRLSRASGGTFKPKASPAELAVRQSIVDIQHSFSRPMTVVVVQPKGGAGKTPTTICLSAAFGAHRGGYVVGWDDNETRGTLAVRVNNPDNQQATVWDLLSDLAAFERYDARVGDLSHYVRAQPDAHFDALVSDDNPGNMAQIGEREYERLHTVLQRFYRMIVVDTGNNVRSSNWQAAVKSADMIVVVSTYQRDVGYSASWVLDHLAQTGREELARKAVTVLTAADPTTDKTVRDQLVPHFRARTRAVCEIPYDQELAHGGPIRWAQLAPATRNAWVHAGATIVNCLAQDDRADTTTRRS